MSSGCLGDHQMHNTVRCQWENIWWKVVHINQFNNISSNFFQKNMLRFSRRRYKNIPNCITGGWISSRLRWQWWTWNIKRERNHIQYTLLENIVYFQQVLFMNTWSQVRADSRYQLDRMKAAAMEQPENAWIPGNLLHFPCILGAPRILVLWIYDKLERGIDTLSLSRLKWQGKFEAGGMVVISNHYCRILVNSVRWYKLDGHWILARAHVTRGANDIRPLVAYRGRDPKIPCIHTGCPPTWIEIQQARDDVTHSNSQWQILLLGRCFKSG
jgi:hypothetical protein